MESISIPKVKWIESNSTGQKATREDVRENGDADGDQRKALNPC